MMSDAKPSKPLPPGTVFPLRRVAGEPKPKITPTWVQRKADWEVMHVKEFLIMIDEKYEDDEAYLNFRIAHDEIEGDHKAFWMLEEIQYLSRLMALVALYKVVEQNTRTILIARFGPDDVEDVSFRVDNLKRWLNSKLTIDLETVAGFDVIDELRLASNAVKHNGGTVSARLVKEHPRWGKVGNDLHQSILEEFNAKAATEVPKYLRALAEAIIV